MDKPRQLARFHEHRIQDIIANRADQKKANGAYRAEFESCLQKLDAALGTKKPGPSLLQRKPGQFRLNTVCHHARHVLEQGRGEPQSSQHRYCGKQHRRCRPSNAGKHVDSVAPVLQSPTARIVDEWPQGILDFTDSNGE